MFKNSQVGLNFLDNINVPEHQIVHRSDKHIKEQAKCLELFNNALGFNRLNKKTIPLHRLSDKHVGYFHSYLTEQMKYANKTYNNKITAVKSFMEWALEKYSPNTKNPFETVRLKSTKTNRATITKKEFEDLINPKNMCPEKGEIKVGKKNQKKRNLYRDYLADGISLCLHTGGRREEVVELRWNMIHEIKGEMAFLEVKNLKVERMLGKGFNDNVESSIVPITKGLK